MKFKAYAKINLSLDIIGKMENGYHDLRMIMHSVDLFDDIDINLNNSGKITVATNLHYIPNDRKNLAFRAAECFFKETGIKNGVEISIFKRIPVCAGLAGGSTDAAAVLRGLNELTGAGLSTKKLAEIGKTLGADVPYCVHGGTMLAEGIGELLTPLTRMPKVPMVLAKPAVNLSTQHVFREVDVKSIKLHPDTKGIIKSLEEGNLDGICKRMFNVLEKPAKTVLSKTSLPDCVEKLKKIMTDCNASGTLMSGSGPTVYGIFYNQKDAEHAYSKARKYSESIFLTTT